MVRLLKEIILLNLSRVLGDKAEEQLMKPIYNEAKKRGYKVLMTMNKYEKCEIGVYCQHKNFPQFSKFSVIMLHDIIQAYGRWPDLWYLEPWNKYDVGILPGNRWVENWNQCSQYFYTRPKNGMYKVGWPKADVLAGIDGKSNREQFYEEHNMDINKPTILYAPAWENDGKQDDTDANRPYAGDQYTNKFAYPVKRNVKMRAVNGDLRCK